MPDEPLAGIIIPVYNGENKISVESPRIVCYNEKNAGDAGNAAAPYEGGKGNGNIKQ